MYRAYSHSCSYFFSATGPSVKILSVATGEVVSTLTPPPNSVSGVAGSSQHSDAVTAAILNPHNPFQLITGSLDGYIRTWDFLDTSLLQTISISQPIFHLAAHEQLRDHVFVAAARPTKQKTNKGALSSVASRERFSLSVIFTQRVSRLPRTTSPFYAFF